VKKVTSIVLWLFSCQHILRFLNGQGTQGYVVNPVMLIMSLCGLVFLTIPFIGYVFFERER
jgi:TM2 domain-containing membrane protein YozV